MVARHSTTLALVEHTFSQFKQEPAFSCMGHTLSYEEIDGLSLEFAKFLHHGLGLRQGDRLAVQLPNILQFPVVMYGAMRAGVVIVNLNPLYTPREIEQQLNDSGALALVVLANIAANAAEIIDKTPVKRVIVTDLADLHPQPKRMLINFAVRYVKKLVPKYSFKDSLKFRECFNSSFPNLPKITANPEDTLMLQYTGGTTGVAKGAMLSQHNIASNIWQVATHLPEAFGGEKLTFLACLPMYHIYALNLHGLGSFAAGCHNVLVPNPRDLDNLVKTMQQFKIDVFVGINTLFNALCRHEGFKALDFSPLKLSASGGMALTEDAAKAWFKVTGCQICEGYGLTETSPVAAANQPGDIHQGTIGKVLPETEVKIVNDEGVEVPVGEVGEILIRGPQVMKGYWLKEEETQNVLSEDGWLSTGDLANVDKDGFITIVDRKKDMILVSGFNVYPNEVEDVLCQMPEVVEAAAVGVPDPDCGEKVKVFVVPAQEGLTVKQVRDFCKTKLTAYKVPSIVEFSDSLPKSSVGKILRKELR